MLEDYCLTMVDTANQADISNIGLLVTRSYSHLARLDKKYTMDHDNHQCANKSIESTGFEIIFIKTTNLQNTIIIQNNYKQSTNLIINCNMYNFTPCLSLRILKL